MANTFGTAGTQPGPFDTFIGNDTTVRVLRASLLTGRAAHAYLLTGPPQVGKRTLAVAMAATLVCERYPARTAPCGACRQCRLVEKGTHADVRLVAPEPGRRGITIEQVRQLDHAAGLRPYEAQRKLFVLRGADGMMDAAANALLKTLEEPPEDTVLVLTSGEAGQVLPTIASRCREVPLRPVPASTIAAALQERGIAPGEAARLSRLAGGRPGWALAAAADPARVAERDEQLSRLEALLALPPVERLPAAGSAGDAAAASQVLDVWLSWWRDALLVQQGCVDLVMHQERLEALRRLGAAHTAAQVWRAIARIQEARQHVEANVNVRLAMEGLLLDLPAPVPEHAPEGAAAAT